MSACPAWFSSYIIFAQFVVGISLFIFHTDMSSGLRWWHKMTLPLFSWVLSCFFWIYQKFLASNKKGHLQKPNDCGAQLYPIVGRSLVPSQSLWLSAIISSLGSLNLRFFKRLQKAVKPARKPGAFEKPHRLRTQKCPGRSPVALGTQVQVEAPHTVGLLTFGSAFPSFHWPLCLFLANGSVEHWQFRREPREKTQR